MDGLLCVASNRSNDSSNVARPTVDGLEHVVLGTCERHETYVFAPGGFDHVERAHILRGKRVAIHLLRVASGLESRIVGEPHILGQVRKAFGEAEVAGHVGPMLAALFRAAVRTGRRVRSEAGLNPSRESVVTMAVRRLVGELCDLKQKRVGIVGTGQIAQSVMHALVQKGVTELTVFSRSQGRARRVRPSGDAVVLNHAELTHSIPKLDALITCSRVEQPILRASDFDRSVGRLMVIDLGSPPNVEPSGVVRDGISFTCLNDFTRSAPTSQVVAAEAIVAEELHRFETWFHHRQVARSIERMVREADLPPTRCTPTLHAKIMQVKSQVAA